MKLFSEISFIVKEKFLCKKNSFIVDKTEKFLHWSPYNGTTRFAPIEIRFSEIYNQIRESVVDLMSMGYGGSARLVLQDEKTAIYEYSPYNLNEIEYRNNERIYDGLIKISKDGLVEPDIHEKLKRMPSGRKKLVVKRVRRDVNYRELLLTEKVIIENSRYCWRFVGTDNNIGMVAMKLVFHIFDQYQYDGVLPEVMRLNY